jgi:hypothetical protein
MDNTFGMFHQVWLFSVMGSPEDGQPHYVRCKICNGSGTQWAKPSITGPTRYIVCMNCKGWGLVNK